MAMTSCVIKQHYSSEEAETRAQIKGGGGVINVIFTFMYINFKQELQEVLKFPIELFLNLEASLKS